MFNSLYNEPLVRVPQKNEREMGATKANAERPQAHMMPRKVCVCIPGGLRFHCDYSNGPLDVELSLIESTICNHRSLYRRLKFMMNGFIFYDVF